MKRYIKKFFCIILSVIFLLITLPHGTHIFAISFTGIDSQNGSAYSVKQDDFTVTITYEDVEATLTIDDKILNSICIDKNITLLCATKDLFYSLYTYNIHSKSLDYYVTDLKADLQSPVFSVNTAGNICLLNKDNKRVIDIFRNNSFSSVTLSSAVYQIMQTDNEGFLVFATDGVYSLNNNIVEHISSITPATPCRYISEGLFEDALGKLYIYSELKFSPYIPQTTTQSPDIPSSITAIENYIYLDYGTTFAKFCKSLNINKSQLTVKKPDGKIITSGKLGTGMFAELSDKTYETVIIGDLTGEGNINSRDLKVLMKHLSEEVLLKNPFLKAADTYSDSDIDTKDLLKLSNMY